jgi:dolichyl-phosphate beta-glucosyltransferase
MQATAPRLSIVLPCYNGASYIRQTLTTLHGWLESRRDTIGTSELILAVDGATDDTAAAANASGVPVRVVQIEPHRGKGAAVRSGMLAATGTFRIFMDADLPFDLAVIAEMLRYLDVKEFDLCIGSRAAKGTAYAVQRPGERRLASLLFTELVGRLVVTGVRDTQCGVKGFRAPIAEYLFRESKVDSFAFDVELLYLAFKNGFDVKTIPVRLNEDKPSTVRVLQHGLPMLIEVLELPFRYHRGGYRLYGPQP